ncbi:HNH endonuclease [Pseudarthrobacter sp. NamE5]|uniref:HNH endonuclease n=1 Tax=Pseudarthrobacter sp. NamE5 TaxID=2576839 RepID=UPI00110AABF8|nr:HNH endonuclease [Pseudarthrobacter sp. NamE5]TLM87494.1 restriction endonuclease [Pseudarthrobacter sp. NamE5]
MAAVILGWNAGQWNRWNYRAVLEQVLAAGRFLDRWEVSEGGTSVPPGTEAWLLFQGSGGAASGLLGHGVMVSEPLAAEQLHGDEASGLYTGIVFDALLPFGEQIPSDALFAAVPGIPWDRALHVSLLPVPPSAEQALRRLWREQGPPAIDPAELVPGTHPPDAVSSIEVNRYERDPDARRVCVAFHGTACAACGFSFEAAYGEIGEGFIQVHHTVPASLLGSGYELDPVTDLVPLCPNCHAMVHLGVTAPRSVPELRTAISAAGHLRGEVVSEQALEAQENARRILEGP